MREVFKDEEGNYGTIPDGDEPTMQEKIDFEAYQKFKRIKPLNEMEALDLTHPIN